MPSAHIAASSKAMAASATRMSMAYLRGPQGVDGPQGLPLPSFFFFFLLGPQGLDGPQGLSACSTPCMSACRLCACAAGATTAQAEATVQADRAAAKACLDVCRFMLVFRNRSIEVGAAIDS